MRNITNLFKFDLQLFGDGAAAGAAAGGAAAPAGDGGMQANGDASAKAEGKTPGSSRRGKTGEPMVIYGKQDAATAEGTTTSDAGGMAQAEGNNTPEAKQKAFREMIKGEFKEQFSQEAQSIINRRFKETKGMEQSLAAQQPIIDMMMHRYGIEGGDMAKLREALEKDNAFWESVADQAGLTVEQYRAQQKLAIENEHLRKLEAQRKGQEQFKQQMATWMQDAERVKESYPSFDLEKEAADKNFVDLLKRGVPMLQAYQLLHMAEIEAAAAKAAAQTASAQMAANIKAKAARPTENGMSKQSAAIVKNDVHSLTKADRAEAARQAMRGAKIRW